jgi:C_GCAxxG_C_C family probable redox protein
MTHIAPEQARANALAGFAETGPKHTNCAQTVVAFALEMMGEDPDLVVTGRYFGGGIAGMGEACGALTGAALALGLRDYRRNESDADRPVSMTDLLKSLIGDFAGEFGSRRCADLTGHDLSTPEGRELFMKSEMRDKCPLYVGWVCDRLAPVLVEQKTSIAGTE